jgi:hypothetical protein
LISDFGNAAQGLLGEILFGLKVNDSGEILVVDEDTGPDFKAHCSASIPQMVTVL